MRRYFASEPRLSRQEIESQAQAAIDARVSLGRPPDEEFAPLRARLAEIDQALASRPPVEPVPEPEPIRIHHVQVPAGESKPKAKPRARREAVAAGHQNPN